MLGVSTIERLEKLARKGDLRRIDLSVRDIAGGWIGDLPPNTTAANFGKISADATPEDKALAIIDMITESIGVLALASARACGQENIVLTGKLSRLFRFMQEMKRLGFPFGRRFLVPEHADFATAIGAARHARQQSRLLSTRLDSCRPPSARQERNPESRGALQSTLTFILSFTGRGDRELRKRSRGRI